MLNLGSFSCEYLTVGRQLDQTLESHTCKMLYEANKVGMSEEFQADSYVSKILSICGDWRTEVAYTSQY